MDKLLIKQLIIEQEEEVRTLFKGGLVDREIMPRLKDIFGTDLIKVVMGVRRSGKSVLSHQLLKDQDYGYVNFDDERMFSVRAIDLNHFLEALIEIKPGLKYLLFDEIQNVEGWELFVNRLKRQGYNIIVTGSNSALLSKELATHITGRHFGIELFPFSFREFLLSKGAIFFGNDFYNTEKRAEIRKWLEEYIVFGGFPEIQKLDAKAIYLRELFDKLVTRDIILRHGIKYVRVLKEIALYAVSNFASKMSYNKIRNIFDVKSVHTVKNYFGYLEDSYLLFQLPPFSVKLKERLTGNRKVYCIDTGMINAIASKISPDDGRLLENVVFLELRRSGREIYYYPSLKGEVDFVVKNGLQVEELIQVSYSIFDPSTKKREVRALSNASKELGCDRLTIITWDEEEIIKLDGKTEVKVVPIWKWLLGKS